MYCEVRIATNKKKKATKKQRKEAFLKKITRKGLLPMPGGPGRGGPGRGGPGRGSAPESELTTEEERERIERWLIANRDSLNAYGDRQGTMYMGGNPLFDERTATRRNKYDYIVNRHPDKPWN